MFGQQHLLGKLFLKLNGIYGRVGCPRIFRRIVTDRETFINSIAELLKLDFDRLVVGHGAVVEKGAKESLRKAFAVDLASQHAA
jgi:glyoxylase-like metal-dependent hydrolase (beta-lactamase superfamily II)